MTTFDTTSFDSSLFFCPLVTGGTQEDPGGGSTVSPTVVSWPVAAVRRIICEIYQPQPIFVRLDPKGEAKAMKSVAADGPDEEAATLLKEER